MYSEVETYVRLRNLLSGVTFVYSSTQISIDSSMATGQRIPAIYALDLLGSDCISEVLQKGRSLLPHIKYERERKKIADQGGEIPNEISVEDMKDEFQRAFRQGLER